MRCLMVNTRDERFLKLFMSVYANDLQKEVSLPFLPSFGHRIIAGPPPHRGLPWAQSPLLSPSILSSASWVHSPMGTMPTTPPPPFSLIFKTEFQFRRVKFLHSLVHHLPGLFDSSVHRCSLDDQD